MKITNDSRSAVVPAWLLATNVPALSIRVYALLDSRLSDGRRPDLAEKCGVSVRTIDSALAELERVGAVSVIETPGRANAYEIHDARPVQNQATPLQLAAGVAPSHIEKRAREVRTNSYLEQIRDTSHFKLSRLLAARVSANVNREIVPTASGVKAMQRLLGVDGASVEDVERVIAWATNDDFWSLNILSPQKLRKQFTRLQLEMKRAGGRRRNVTGADLRRVAEELRKDGR